MDAVKLLLIWDIDEGNEEEYFEFHVRRLVPTLDRMNITLHEAWLTVFGTRPRMTVEAMIPSIEVTKEILHSEEWHLLVEQLSSVVKNFEYKVLHAKRGIQL
jgi:hypothetical protein